jgi:hypothetical protein
MNCSSSANATTLVEALGNGALRETEHHAVDEDVLAAGDFRMKPGAELDERGHTSLNFYRSDVGLPMPAISFSIVLLPDPFRPMSPNVRPASTSKDTSFSASST